MPTRLPPPKPPDPHECYYCARGLVHPPRVHVRIPPRPLDPILARSLLALAVGLTLIALGAILA